MNKLILLLSLIIIGNNVTIFASPPSVSKYSDDYSQRNIIGKTSKFQIYEKEPVIINQVQPRYPEFAYKAGIEGSVRLQVEIFSDGAVGAIEVVKSLMSGPFGLDEAAINAVKQWKFSPATIGEKSLAVWFVMDVEFRLDDEKEIRKTSKFMIYDRSPIIINKFQYPEFAKTAGIEATIVVEVEVELFKDGTMGATDVKCPKIFSIDGSFIEIENLTNNELDNFETKAINEVLQWEFSSAIINREFVDVWIVVNVEFRSKKSHKKNNKEIVREICKTPKQVFYDEPPIPIKQIPTKYSNFAHHPINGAVTLEVEIFADGTVGATEVNKSLMSGHGGLDEAAINAVKQWEFTPALKDGKPIAVWVVFDVNFF